MNNKSWEYYQQPYTGTKYPLFWIAGCATPGPLANNTLAANELYLIPFDVMRQQVTLDKMGIQVTTADPNGKVRLGIYSNNSDSDNYPKTRLVTTAELSLSGTGLVEDTGLDTNLSADTRYWAALLTNSSNAQIKFLGEVSLIFWGAKKASNAIIPISWNVIPSVTYGNLPHPAPVNGAGDLDQEAGFPVIYMGFSAVM